jgi:hypothetical protein
MNAAGVTVDHGPLAAVRLEEAKGGKMVVSVPGTDYLLELVPAAATATPVGKRLTGTIMGRAQKFHRATAGGEFIEPVEGHPRIVQGRIREVDAAGNRVLLHAVVPMWVSLSSGQTATSFQPGDFVNFYMESGVQFAPTSATSSRRATTPSGCLPACRARRRWNRCLRAATSSLSRSARPPTRMSRSCAPRSARESMC